jgi:hypothetical protein
LEHRAVLHHALREALDIEELLHRLRDGWDLGLGFGDGHFRQLLPWICWQNSRRIPGLNR